MLKFKEFITITQPILKPFVLFRSQNVLKSLRSRANCKGRFVCMWLGGERCKCTYIKSHCLCTHPRSGNTRYTHIHTHPLPAMVVCGGQFVYYLHGYFSAGRTCRQIEPRANFQDPTGRTVTTAVIGGAIRCRRKSSQWMSVVLTYISSVNSPYILTLVAGKRRWSFAGFPVENRRRPRILT